MPEPPLPKLTSWAIRILKTTPASFEWTVSKKIEPSAFYLMRVPTDTTKWHVSDHVARFKHLLAQLANAFGEIEASELLARALSAKLGEHKLAMLVENAENELDPTVLAIEKGIYAAWTADKRSLEDVVEKVSLRIEKGKSQVTRETTPSSLLGGIDLWLDFPFKVVLAYAVKSTDLELTRVLVNQFGKRVSALVELSPDFCPARVKEAYETTLKLPIKNLIEKLHLKGAGDELFEKPELCTLLILAKSEGINANGVMKALKEVVGAKSVNSSLKKARRSSKLEPLPTIVQKFLQEFPVPAKTSLAKFFRSFSTSIKSSVRP